MKTGWRWASGASNKVEKLTKCECGFAFGYAMSNSGRKCVILGNRPDVARGTLHGDGLVRRFVLRRGVV